MSLNSSAFAASDSASASSAGKQLAGDLVQRGQVDRGGKDVVGRLAHVHVIVAVNGVAGEVGDDLVGVHVRGGPGASLEDVDRELLVVLAGGDRVARRGDLLGDVGVEQAELGVDAGGVCLDPAKPADHGHGDALARDREVLNCFRRLRPP